jgi:hypothetical protein
MVSHAISPDVGAEDLAAEQCGWSVMTYRRPVGT